MNVVSTRAGASQARISDAEWDSILAHGAPILPELYFPPGYDPSPRRREPRSARGWRRSLHAAVWDSQRTRARIEIVAAYRAGADALDAGTATWAYRPKKGDAESLRSWAHQLDGCSRRWLVAWPSGRPDAARPVPGRCMDRLCPACSEVRAARIVRYLEARAAELPPGGRLRLMTLTQIKRVGESPRAARARLRASVQRFRRSAGWAQHVTGALVRYEETHDDAGGWHAHAHLVTAGTFWDQADLSNAWSDAVGDGVSRIVDIRQIKGTAGLREVAKYTAKVASLDPLVVAEYRLAMAGLRDLSCLGAWYHLPVNGYDADDPTDDPDDDRPERAAWDASAKVEVVHLDALEARVRAGDPEAIAARSAVLAWLERTRDRRDRRVDRSRRRRRTG